LYSRVYSTASETWYRIVQPSQHILDNSLKKLKTKL